MAAVEPGVLLRTRVLLFSCCRWTRTKNQDDVRSCGRPQLRVWVIGGSSRTRRDRSCFNVVGRWTDDVRSRRFPCAQPRLRGVIVGVGLESDMGDTTCRVSTSLGRRTDDMRSNEDPHWQCIAKGSAASTSGSLQCRPGLESDVHVEGYVGCRVSTSSGRWPRTTKCRTKATNANDTIQSKNPVVLGGTLHSQGLACSTPSWRCIPGPVY